MPARFFSLLFVACYSLMNRGLAAPVILGGTHSPPLPAPGESVSVTVEITGAAQAVLNWRPDGGPAFTPVPMTLTGATWTGTIPAQSDGTVVEFAVTATGGGTAIWPS